MNYGIKLKSIRENAGLYQKDLADKINTNQGNISFWEKSSYPPLDAIEKICNALNIKVWEFFIEDPEELKNYMPSWIQPQQLTFLELFNQLPEKKQLKYLNAFTEILMADE